MNNKDTTASKVSIKVDPKDGMINIHEKMGIRLIEFKAVFYFGDEAPAGLGFVYVFVLNYFVNSSQTLSGAYPGMMTESLMTTVGKPRPVLNDLNLRFASRS